MVFDGFQKQFKSLIDGLKRSRQFVSEGMAKIFDEKDSTAVMEGLEELLIQADVGAETAAVIVEEVASSVGKKDKELLKKAIEDSIVRMVESAEPKAISLVSKPYVIMVVGVNGSGKTTTIAKLAHLFKSQGKSVLLAACDTFRAAAIEQLEVWAKRVGVDVVKQKPGGDPAAVAFDALSAACARDIDVVIIDTAGRLQTKKNLMQELSKIARVTGRAIEGAPHQVLLVLDATTGQNALSQAKAFSESCGITGIIIAKLDGTAKGGIVVAVARQFKIPILYVGVGEKLEDLVSFDARAFSRALLS
ncbi:MAG: signal recognition particle-docking protein FtsY [bacterium]